MMKSKISKEKITNDVIENGVLENTSKENLFFIPKEITDYIEFEYTLIRLSCISNGYFEFERQQQKLYSNNGKKIDEIIITRETNENLKENKSYFFDITDVFN